MAAPYHSAITRPKLVRTASFVGIWRFVIKGYKLAVNTIRKWWDYNFSSLYPGIRYIPGSLYRGCTVYAVKVFAIKQNTKIPQNLVKCCMQVCTNSRFILSGVYTMVTHNAGNDVIKDLTSNLNFL
jgi:hypothetical protein